MLNFEVSKNCISMPVDRIFLETSSKSEDQGCNSDNIVLGGVPIHIVIDIDYGICHRARQVEVIEGGGNITCKEEIRLDADVTSLKMRIFCATAPS